MRGRPGVTSLSRPCLRQAFLAPIKFLDAPVVMPHMPFVTRGQAAVRRWAATAPGEPRAQRVVPVLVLGAALGSLLGGCNTEPGPMGTSEGIRIGVSLPFTGKESAMGRNIEQAMLLALEDVNAAGAIDGTALEFVTRDSNSGTERGLNDLLDLLYNEKVRYLVGPEENELASQIVADIRALDAFNLLPGYAAPSSKASSSTGAWLRLAPSPFSIACGLGAHAIAEGAQTANALYSQEDYNSQLATDFRFQFRSMGGKVLSAVTIKSDQNDFGSTVDKVVAANADQTLLIAYPATAADLVTEWAVAGRRGKWYLSPLLRTEAFLLNIPFGALDGSFGLSPTRSLVSECEMLEGYGSGPIPCKHDNADRFIAHFVARWDGARPFAASHYYYDAVVLLAMGMQYAVATNGSIPQPVQLHRLIRSLNRSANEPMHWHDLASGFKALGAGKPLRYVGAAAEYEFDDFGTAQYRTFDSWTIRENRFVQQGVYYASCLDIGAM